MDMVTLPHNTKYIVQYFLSSVRDASMDVSGIDFDDDFGEENVTPTVGKSSRQEMETEQIQYVDDTIMLKYSLNHSN